MNSVLHDLKNLQEVDDQIRLDRLALSEGAARLTEAAARFKAFEERLAALRRELEGLKSRHQELEVEVAGLSAKKSHNEKRQSAVKNNTEYTALLKEAEYLGGRVNELEDETLEVLDRQEKREVEIAGLELVVSDEAARYAQTAAEIEKAQTGGRARLDGLAARRQALVAALPPDRLKQYDDLVKTRAGRAVTAAADGLCLACRLGFPPQVFNELQRNEKILTCPNCNRVIYWRDHPDFKDQELEPTCVAK